ncbi:MAG: PAS domain S-box protein [Phycicoccus sp.]|nr:PAS domain S-box protein [Phycicoccus sp.]
MPEQTTFEGLLEAVPDALIGVDPSGAIRFVNHQAELLFGYDRTELVGQPLEILVPESLRTSHVAHRHTYLSAPLARSMGSGLELTGRHRDGTEIPVDISLSHLNTADGLLVIASVRDMTERKRAQEAQLRVERLSAIVEFSGEAIFSSTLDGIITEFNRAAENTFGYTQDEIVGMSRSLLSPKDRADEASGMLATIRTGQPVMGFETIRVRKDGTEFPVSLTVSPIFDRDGTVVGASTITRDVTSQKQAFEAARSMIESSLDSLVAISPEGMITDANDATVKVTGIPREELIGTAFSDCFTEPEKANAIYQLVFEQGMAVDYPLTMRHRDGSLTDVLYNAAVQRDSGGNVLGVYAAARDVTKQRQAGAQYTRSLLEAALDPLVTISPEGMITDVNEATIKATGVPRGELIGTDFSDYFTEPDKAKEGYRLAFERGSVTDYPLTLRRPDGTLSEVLYNASVYRDEAGDVLGVFAAARDVTETRLAQAELARQSKELDRLAELERFQRLTVGRELKMIELKKEIESLRRLVQRDEGDSDDQR